MTVFGAPCVTILSKMLTLKWPATCSDTGENQLHYILYIHLIYTVSQKNIPECFSYNSPKHCRIFIIFGRNITEKASKQRIYIFPPHLINASALPCKTENTELYLFK